MSIKPKSVTQLYRDCLRLIKHIAGDSPKGAHLRGIVGAQFRANKDEVDELRIHEMKAAAERSLSNYFLFEHMQKNPKFDKFREQTEEDMANMHNLLVSQAEKDKEADTAGAASSGGGGAPAAGAGAGAGAGDAAAASPAGAGGGRAAPADRLGLDADEGDEEAGSSLSPADYEDDDLLSSTSASERGSQGASGTGLANWDDDVDDVVSAGAAPAPEVRVPSYDDLVSGSDTESDSDDEGAKRRRS